MSGVRPFLKWAGGKYKLAEKISEHFGAIGAGTYYEPFLGGASVFFNLKPHAAVLSDENAALIGAYRCVKAYPRAVHKKLAILGNEHDSAHYYSVRDQFNEATGTAIEQAARFIYLNKAGFNGIYRVNRQGHYNVPEGKRKTLALPSLENLLNVSERLADAVLINADFELVAGHAEKGDFVYLDPPYPALNDTSFFNHYTADRFSGDEQSRVARVARDLHSKGCRVVVSNADTPEVRELYRGWEIISIELRRWITAAKAKHFVREIIVLSPR